MSDRDLKIAIKRATARLKRDMNDGTLLKKLEKSGKQIDEYLDDLARKSRVDPRLLDIPADI